MSSKNNPIVTKNIPLNIRIRSLYRMNRLPAKLAEKPIVKYISVKPIEK